MQFRIAFHRQPITKHVVSAKVISMKNMKRLKIIGLVILGNIIFWLFGLKLIFKYMKKGSAPCPASISWIVDLPPRKCWMRPILDRVGIKPGETVLELGPGPGAFTVDAAQRLQPDGKLIAVDIQPEMIAKVEERVKQAGLTNVETHVASAYDLPLEDASVDRVFLVTVLPEIPDPVRGLHEIRRVLKPDGVLSTSEEFLDPDYPRRRTTIQWAEAAGFELDYSFGNWWVYTLNFRKRL
ncbi:MAG: dimethylmenaquinone methyltransferase [Chloroflexi bacterium]|nr:MAG: dimethylmenaquinone methyltransferase [Chloroflexota bacterium]PIE82518.1 MAG: dimethylmenaquinone methyltransferase [Chloroflexota bacterium]